jgi:hypothetical protein
MYFIEYIIFNCAKEYWGAESQNIFKGLFFFFFFYKEIHQFQWLFNR